MKVCSKCKQEYPIESFARKTGTRRNSWCKFCVKVVSDRHYQNNKDKIKKRSFERNRREKDKVRKKIAEYLLENPCVDCGEDNILFLDFDHRDGKISPVGQMVLRNRLYKDILDEISKCDIRCVKCHRLKTARDFNWWQIRMGYV